MHGAATLDENFCVLLAEFSAGDPRRQSVLWTNLSRREISINSKKKELISNFSREGHTHTQAQVQTLDHDFPSTGQGKLIPHGLYDVVRNEGYMHLNTSIETSEFCCDSIAHWWDSMAANTTPYARRLLLLCDGGSSNASNRHVFKEALQQLAERLGLEIRVAHYPMHSSKPNSIEHRLFAHVMHACQGVTFHTVDIARQFIAKAKTITGLKMTVKVLGGVYVKGKKSRRTFLKTYSSS